MKEYKITIHPRESIFSYEENLHGEKMKHPTDEFGRKEFEKQKSLAQRLNMNIETKIKIW